MAKHLLLRGFILLSALMLFFEAEAQTKEHFISLSVKDKSVEEILKVIEKQIPYKFMYHTDDIKALGKKSLDLKEVKLDVAMDACLKGTNIGYQIVEDLIVLKRISKQPSTTKKRMITGLVTDDKGEPLVGAFVALAGTNIAQIVDAEGKFVMIVPHEEQSAILVTFVGYGKKMVIVTDNNPVKVSLTPDAMAVDDVVVTGYQNISRKDMVGSATQLKAKDIMITGVTNISQMLQGQVAGMIVTNTSARAGATPKIQIRGQSTLSNELGNQNPIWVVDGIIQDEPIQINNMTGVVDDLAQLIGNQVSWLNPLDIETITVLKDASATAIYGSRASNGVIVITTKKPSGERVSITYSGSATIKSKPRYQDFNYMNSQERVIFSEELMNLGFKYKVDPIGDMNTFEGLVRLYNDRMITSEEYLRRRAQLETVNTDWFDVLTRNSMSQNHNISMMGRASDKISFTASVGYTNDLGQEISNRMERFTSRISVTANPSPKFRINFSMNGTINKTLGVPSGNNTGLPGGGSPLSYATKMSRAIPAYEEDGSNARYKVATKYKYNVDNTLSFNMLEEMNETSAINKGGRISFALDLNWDVTKWLKYQLTAGYNYSDVTREIYRSERSFYVSDTYRGYDYGSATPNSEFYNAALMPHGGVFDENKGIQNSYNIQNKLLFARKINGVHSMNAMFANEVRSSQQNDFSTSVWGYLPERGNALVMPPYSITPITGTHSTVDYGILNALYNGGRTKIFESKNNFVSLFATFAYSYDDRYVLNVNVRNDLSNRFGQDTNRRFDPTYSFGLKWSITNEPFMKEKAKWLTNMNISITHGIQGNAQLAMSPDLVLIKGGIDKVYKVFSSKISSIPNPNLSWERTYNWNYSASLRLFNAVNVNVDYYTRKSNSVVTQNIGFENGVTSMQLNGGVIHNNGIEASIAFSPVVTKDFGLNVAINSSKNWNKGGETTLKTTQLRQIGFYTSGATNQIIKEGYPLGAIWSYAFARLDDETGEPIFYNEDVDPEVAKLDPTSLMVYSGKTTPDFTGGLNLTVRYKKLTLRSAFSAVLGGKVRLPNPYQEALAGSFNLIPTSQTNVSKDLVNRWKRPGDEQKTIYPSIMRSGALFNMPGQRGEYRTKLWADSDAMIVNKGFLRCQDVSLSYVVDNSFTKRLRLSTLNVGLSATNLFVIGSKRFNGFDPELGNSVMPKTYSVSLNIGF